MINRRSLLRGLAASLVAPAVVRAEWLDFVPRVQEPLILPYKIRMHPDEAFFYCPYIPLLQLISVHPKPIVTRYAG